LGEWTRLAEARLQLEEGSGSGRQGGLKGTVVDGSITLALVEQAKAHFDAGQELLRQGERIVRAWEDVANTLRVGAVAAGLQARPSRAEVGTQVAPVWH
jgi:hypothetical protein